MPSFQRLFGTLLFIFSALTFCAPYARAYAVLTHEELVDLAWNESIRPFLIKQFPDATEAQLKDAHAYAYGGSAIQDMGYYPFGARFFSDLTHYVRAGDFVSHLFRDAKTINEYAFALGALSHYYGDTIGHSQAINPATAVEFPKLRKKYGSSVTYDQSPHGHVRTEFAFDVDQLSDQNFAPPAYLRFIGLKVAGKILDRAFLDTYGLDIHEVLRKRLRPATRSYRTSVRTFIPSFAEAEVILHRNKFPHPPDDDAHRTFTERVARTNFERRWSHTYKAPGFRIHLLAAVVFLIPKIGPAANLAIKIPSSETELSYIKSVNHTVDQYDATIRQVKDDDHGLPPLANLDLDTGSAVKFGDYPLADQTYSKLLERLVSDPLAKLTLGLKQDILGFYSESEPSNKNVEARRRVQPMLDRLSQMPVH